jgi:glyceraldehyde 3-phosphate dehydrogenase
MALRVAIQGYGRIGRMLHRQLLENNVSGIEIVAVNSRRNTPAERAHLLKYDSIYRTSPLEISADDEHIIVTNSAGKTMKTKSLNIGNIDNLPWKELEVDVVLEATGMATKADFAQKHIDLGAKRVLVSAPMKDDTPMNVFGVNDDEITPEKTIFSNASCTTNCIASPLKALHDAIGIKSFLMTTIHSFTDSQNLLDNSAKDMRKARSGVQNLIPTTTGAAGAIGKVIPELNGKGTGMAIRVPLATSSITDLSITFEREVSAEELNEVISKRSAQIPDVLGVSSDSLVSTDFIQDTRASILDADSTKVAGGNTAQMLFWYDNEWGYVARLVDFLKKIASFQ